MTIVAAMLSPSFCAISRAMVSVPAPGGKGTTSLIVLSGYAPAVCALAVWNRPGIRVEMTSDATRNDPAQGVQHAVAKSSRATVRHDKCMTDAEQVEVAQQVGGHAAARDGWTTVTRIDALF